MRRVNHLIWICVAAATLVGASRSYGHGDPIVVHVTAGQLTVSGVNADERGYAEWVAADPDEETFFNLAGSTTAPAFQIFDVLLGQQVFVDLVSRPDYSKPTAPTRWLWYWDPATQQVADVPWDYNLIVGSQDAGVNSQVSFRQSVATVTTFQLANLNNASEIGAKQHFAGYFLPGFQLGAIGAYGFFARLTAPGFSPSEPFLVTLNHSIDAAAFQLGAREINAAARLPGDYDGDDDVDGGDLLAWQRTLGSTTQLAADGSLDEVVNAADLAVWRQNYGRVSPAAIGAMSAVPEPAGAALSNAIAIAWALASGASRRFARRKPGLAAKADVAFDAPPARLPVSEKLANVRTGSHG